MKLPASYRHKKGVTTYALDVSDREAYQAFVAQVVSDHGQVDIVINNAGIVRLHSIDQGSYEDWEKTFDTNIWGVLYGCDEHCYGSPGDTLTACNWRLCA
jgi:NADP-dependent 3-hydroxy acid dehydrogenase YdfG